MMLFRIVLLWYSICYPPFVRSVSHLIYWLGMLFWLSWWMLLFCMLLFWRLEVTIAFVSLFWILLCTKVYISSVSIHICALVEIFILGLLSDGDSSLSLSPLLEDESSNEYPKDTPLPFSVSGGFGDVSCEIVWFPVLVFWRPSFSSSIESGFTQLTCSQAAL